MRKTSILMAGLAALAISGSSASAMTLGLDTGWQYFTFAATGSTWSDNFTFTIANTAYFAVTDSFCAGDQFSFSVNGTYTGDTSIPFFDGTCNDGTTRTTDPDLAFSSSLWSSGELALAAGTYTITGSALASPFGAGGAYAQLSSTSRGGPVIQPPSVPLPASGVVLLAGLGGLAALRRRKV